MEPLRPGHSAKTQGHTPLRPRLDPKYAEPADRLIELCASLLGHTHFITRERRFEGYDPSQSVLGAGIGKLTNIILRIQPNRYGIIQNETDFKTRLICQLKEKFGEEMFSRLVLQYGKRMNGTYCLVLKLDELLKLNPNDAVPDEKALLLLREELAVRDAMSELHTMMSDDVTPMKEEFILMYKIFIGFKHALASEPGYDPQNGITDGQLHDSFVKYIKSNLHHLTTIKQIFSSPAPEVNEAKFNAFFQHCFDKGDEYADLNSSMAQSKSNWYYGLKNPVECCYIALVWVNKQ